jgi:hypothetical protein
MLASDCSIQSISEADLKLKRLINKGFLAFFEPTVCKFYLLRRVPFSKSAANGGFEARPS